MKKVTEMSNEELRAEFERRKASLVEVRDEIDRRERDKGRPGVNVDFTKYVEE